MNVFTLDDFLSTFDNPEVKKFREWVNKREFSSVLLALELYRASTGAKLTWKDLAPF